MTRPRKCRKVCQLPRTTEFIPSKKNFDWLILTVDEYECLRLIDKEGYSQEQCATYMQVARTTVQSVYQKARYKVSCALVDGCALKIEGGDYIVCSGESNHVGCGHCKKRQHGCHACLREGEEK